MPLATPLTTTRPTELEFEALTWQNFEKLLCWLVPKLERTQNVHLYGRPGQAQHGIDIVCLPSDCEPTVYQAKRYEAFGASDLCTAVADFANGPRPFDAQKFVVVVACRANDTTTMEMLGSVSVATGTSASSCGIAASYRVCSPIIRTSLSSSSGSIRSKRSAGGPARDGSADSAVLSDYVMRGPIRHLGLSTMLRQAEDDEVERPEASATRFGEIAAALRESSFASHSYQYRLRQADMLERVGEVVNASEIRLSVAWELIDSADLWTVNVAARKIAEAAEHLPEPIMRSLNAVGNIVATRLGPGPRTG